MVAVSPKYVAPRAAAIVAAAMLCAPLFGCSGPLFKRDVETGTPGSSRAPDPSALLALRVDTIAIDGGDDPLLRGFAGAIERSSGPERADLTTHRAELLVDVVVVANAWETLDPERAGRLREIAGTIVGRSPGHPEFATVVLDRVARGGGDAESRELFARAALGLGETPADRVATSARARLLRVAEITAGFSPWARFGDLADDGRFAAAVGLGVPVSVDTGALAARQLDSPANLRAARSLAAVAWVVQALIADAEGESDAARAALPVARDLAERLRRSAVPLEIPTGLITADATIEPPLSFLDAPPEAGRGLGFTFQRLVMVRTDGVYAALTPHAAVDPLGERVWCPEFDAGWGLPGRQMLSFEGMGVIAGSDVAHGTAPGVEAALSEMEAYIATVTYLPPEEMIGANNTVGISLIADGDTYFSTLRPILHAFMRGNYSPIALHTHHEGSGALDAVAVRLVPVAGDEDHLLIVREDGYLVQPYDPANLERPRMVSRVTRWSLADLHRLIANGFADGTIDRGRALTVRVDDDTVDYAILAHLLAAVGFSREIDDVARDADLLTAPLMVNERGEPIVLVPGGLRLAL